jgi:hypothetical protein
MAFTFKIPTPQALLKTIVNNPITGWIPAQQQANQNLLTQQEIAAKQNQQRNVMQSLGQYPVDSLGTTRKTYYNPQTGQYQSYPVGAAAPQADTTGSGGGGGTTPKQQITQQDTNLGAEIPGVQPNTFNWASETNKAYDSLKAFYAKLLEFTQGDLDLAKRVLNYTYDQGMRESQQSFEESTKQQKQLFPQEQETLLGALNKRNVYFSGFGGNERTQLKENQDLRALQVQRALENSTSRLTESRETGVQEQANKLTQSKFNLESQRRKEAEGMAQNKYSIGTDIYGTELDKATQAENRRVGTIANQATAQLTGAPAGSKEPTGKTVTQGGATGRIADSSGRLYGGWYPNPATGKSQRYWGSNQWSDS